MIEMKTPSRWDLLIGLYECIYPGCKILFHFVTSFTFRSQHTARQVRRLKPGTLNLSCFTTLDEVFSPFSVFLTFRSETLSNECFGNPSLIPTRFTHAPESGIWKDGDALESRTLTGGGTAKAASMLIMACIFKDLPTVRFDDTHTHRHTPLPYIG